jgi:Immunity protein 52
MMSAAKNIHYFILACWTARKETPDELAGRFVRLIDRLQQIDPTLALWTSGAKWPRKFEALRGHYRDTVEACISTDDFGEALPIDGYWFGAVTREQPASRTYAVRVHAGAHKPTLKHQNDVTFSTSLIGVPAPESITYRIFKSALLAIVDIWEPEDCLANTSEMHQLIDLGNHFREAWMQYLDAKFAAFITPPENVLVEHLANGGLLMSATTETFKVDNPAHLAAARAIGAATLPLNKLAYVYGSRFP